jgi:hypothetical protein
MSCVVICCCTLYLYEKKHKKQKMQIYDEGPVSVN